MRWAFTKSKAKTYAEEDVEVRFDDVAGVDEAKEELVEVVDYLRNPEKYRRLGGKIPRGFQGAGLPRRPPRLKPFGRGATLLIWVPHF